MSSLRHKVNPAFYDDLIEWALIEELLEFFPAEERAEALQSIIASLDSVAHETVLHLIPDEHHPEYLQLCTQYHHDPTLLEWVQNKETTVVEHLKLQLYQTKQALRSALMELETLEEALDKVGVGALETK